MTDQDLANLSFRLGFNANTFTSPKIGGFTRHTLNLIEAIHKAAPKIEIFLYANRELSLSLLKRIPFAKPRIWPVRPYLLWEQIALPLQLGLDSIDVFHSTVNTGVPYFRPFFTGTVQTVHDLFTHDNMAHAPRVLAMARWRGYLGFWPSWWAATSAEEMLTVSEHSKRELVARYPKLARKLQVVPNAADPIFSPGEPDRDVLARFGLDSPYILYVGGFEERKNLSCLVHAYRELKSGMPNAPKLVLVGALDNIPYPLRSVVEKTPGIAALAYCTDEILRELYRGALFGVSPSTREGFGLPAVEFARSGACALLSDIPAYREVAAPPGRPEVAWGGSNAGAAENSFFFDPHDSAKLARMLAEMCESAERRRECAARLQSAGEKYSWDGIARATLEAYARARA